MTSPALRNRYLNDSITTASPGRLLVMLYDRLVLDVAQGEEALLAGDRVTAADKLQHAQEIIIELRSTLDMTVWSGAAGLASLYAYWLAELIGANVGNDAARARAVREQIEPVRDAWREAAAQPAAAG
ncbi:flagellar protein FliS [Catenuloplanes nepalensis]|uniref:Flagellar protein FliS n=1 Tax=Catenuloplanes nepalensis TaxID=587533 RepID=A0ABT9N2W2_9ACTN|nr:flagellar export chaperone FliS [Catenuloplanes nepalensis]MDP9798038.1 flagellar protein FliS [Catenuloplanes nepalensis]